MKIRLFLFFIIFMRIRGNREEEGLISKIDETKYSIAKEEQYLLYDVNYGEGFNLKRDVYMRIANSVRLLRETGYNFILVLPPWGRLHHWNRLEVALPWNQFFDISSLSRFIPVIEFDEFIKKRNHEIIDDVIYLQHYKEGWGNEYIRKFDERPCISNIDRFYKKSKQDGLWDGWFFSYENVRSKRVKCISFQGDSSTLKDLIISNYSQIKSIMIDRAETVLHENYGEIDYWKARRSMRYNKKITKIADQFREEFLNSTDDMDQTLMLDDWTKSTNINRNAIGGPFIGVHWRRKDFLFARKEEIPTIEGTAQIINKLSEKLGLTKVFLATDAPIEEVEELKIKLNKKISIFQFSESKNLNDGQIAIIDQWICAHSRYFIGSHESTFSFRIQEDREILGFRAETTFNRMCPDGEENCHQPAKWKIVY